MTKDYGGDLPFSVVSAHIRQQEEIQRMDEVFQNNIMTGEIVAVDPHARDMHVMELSKPADRPAGTDKPEFLARDGYIMELAKPADCPAGADEPESMGIY